ncbi:MAG TPA: hypothetical protein VFO40_03485 [Chthoniobacterales bacterium]|nr:hypothetical protein [Chthoniobacterales bacterium]
MNRALDELRVLRNISREFVGTSTSASSAIVGPHILRAAVVVTTSGSLNTSADFAKATALWFSSARAMSRTPLYWPTW